MTISARDVTRLTTQERNIAFTTSRIILKNEYMDLKISAAEGKHGKILIITPKKIGNAPFRNNIRRRLKALYYENKLFHKPYFILVYAKSALQSLSYEALKHMLLHALGNIV